MTMLQTLLIEIGVEELPAVPLLKELPNIEKKWADILEENALLCEFEFYYTPRRLVLWHREFHVTQPDSEEEFFGAPVAIAFKDGEPTPAALGFAKKCGVSIDELGRGEKGGKEVLYYKKSIKGQESQQLLNVMVEKWLKSLVFGKTMRWGSSSESFIRPIRWVNVLMNNTLVDMTLFNVASEAKTYGHRMHSFEAIALKDTHQYFDTLNASAVTLFPETRRRNILDNFAQLEKEEAINIEIDEDLLDEVVAITENPTALLGSFDEAFLRLPPEVIITSMKEHQRYFPVFKAGKLVNKFVVVTNALTDDFSQVIAGNETVLRPRLADGLFFFDNDLKRTLINDGLEKVVFMNGLGTLMDKLTREKNVALNLFERYSQQVSSENGYDASKNKTLLERTIELTKADLMSEMVFEFTELQGLMGYYYALEQGEEKEVALGIKEQYLPDGEDAELPSTRLSAIVAMANKLDTLMGLFSINQIPTGSRDPFALRRAVNGLVRICQKHQFRFDITEVFASLAPAYDDFDLAQLETFFLERVSKFYHVNPSVIKAVLASGEREVLEIDAKIKAVDTIVKSENFSTVFSTFKRLANITKDIDLDANLSVNETLFEESAERTLYEAYTKVSNTSYNSYEETLDAFFGLKSDLDLFFEKVMVNAEDETVKTNRKNLIGMIYKSLLTIADIKEISI